MLLRHRLLLPTGRRSCPSFPLVSWQQGSRLWSFQNLQQNGIQFCSHSQAASVCRKVALAWSSSGLLRSVSVVLSRNLSSRARVRATAVQMRLSQLHLGAGEVAVMADNLGVREKAELVSEKLGGGEKDKCDTGGEEDAVVIATEGDIKRGLRRLAGSNIFVGSSLRGLRVKNAEFVKSSPKVSECPRDGLPEIAVVGRSNVGKSSLINTMVNRKELAQTSKRPGKTQLINHFKIDNSWYLVDLPGYGYAKAPTAIRTEWNAFTKDYFLNREELVSVLLLIDASIPPQTIDLDCANWLGRNSIPVTVVFTKCDRKKKNKNGGRRPEVNIQEFETKLKDSFDELPPWVMTSSVTGQGKEEILTHIGNLLKYWRSS